MKEKRTPQDTSLPLPFQGVPIPGKSFQVPAVGREDRRVRVAPGHAELLRFRLQVVPGLVEDRKGGTAQKLRHGPPVPFVELRQSPEEFLDIGRGVGSQGELRIVLYPLPVLLHDAVGEAHLSGYVIPRGRRFRGRGGTILLPLKELPDNGKLGEEEPVQIDSGLQSVPVPFFEAVFYRKGLGISYNIVVIEASNPFDRRRGFLWSQFFLFHHPRS